MDDSYRAVDERTRRMVPTANFRRFNDSQRHALDTRRNLAVRANAGSGKTSVLVERVVQLLARGRTGNPADPPRLGSLVAVTFTRKAATELQERLRESFAERVRGAADADEQAFWAGLIEEIPQSPIGTLDSFCARILREFGWAEGAAERIEPDFEPLEAYDEQILKREAIDRIVNRYGTPPPADASDEESAAAEACQWWASTQGYDALTRHLTTLLNHAVDPALVVRTHRALPPAADRVGAQWDAHPAVRALTADRQHLRDELGAIIGEIAAAKKPPAALTKFREQALAILRDLEDPERRHAENTLRGLRDALLTQEGTPRKQGLALVADRVRPLQETWQPVLARFTFDAEAELYALEAADRLARLLGPAQAEYLQLCQQANRYDYLTVARRARDLLATAPAVRAALRERWRYVMVDEFQDTNRLQWEIVSYLVGAGPDGPLDADRLFVVGDPQQSIYRFRHADVSVFTHVENLIREANARHGHADRPTDYDRMPGARPSQEGQRLGSMPLAENYRSLSPMPLLLLDHVFRYTFDPVAHGLDPDHDAFEVRYQALAAGRPSDPVKPGEVCYIVPGDPEAEADAEEADGEPVEGTSREEGLGQRQVAAVVDRLAGLHGAPKYTGAPGETLAWRDMAVLLPSRTVVLSELERELRRRGVPFVVTKGIGFWQRQEVRDVVNLANCLADPGDELALFAVLRGPLGGLTDTEILFLSQLGERSLVRGLHRVPHAEVWLTQGAQPPDGGLAEDVRAALGEVWRDFPVEAKDRLRAVAGRLAVWRRRVDRLAHTDLLWRSLEESGAFAAYAAEPAGEVALANLDRLFDLLRAEEARVSPGLSRLARKLRRQMDDSFKEEQATLPAGADAVQVMTVHAAKGLEFPVVAVLKMERKADRGSYARLMVVGETDVLLQEDARELPEPRPGTLAVGVRHPRRPRETYKPRLLQALHRLDAAQQVAEGRRLFYVAATRAKERLILAGRPPRTTPKGGRAKLPLSWQRWFEEALGLTEEHQRRGAWTDTSRGFRVPILTEPPGEVPGADAVPAVPTERIALGDVEEQPRVFTLAASDLDALRATWRSDPPAWWTRYRAHLAPLADRSDERPLDAVVGDIVHTLAVAGDALKPQSARGLRGLVETMATSLLAGPGVMDRWTGEYRLAPVRPADVRTVVDAVIRVVSRLRKGTAEARAVLDLLTGPGEMGVDYSLRLGRWHVTGRFDKLLAVGGGWELVDWTTGAQNPLAALALYRSGRVALKDGAVAVHVVRLQDLEIRRHLWGILELEALAADLDSELSTMSTYVPPVATAPTAAEA